jgi:hypothetical protein
MSNSDFELFKIGDKVRCIDSNNYAGLKTGDTYIISIASYKKYSNNYFVQVESHDYNKIECYAKRFKLVTKNSENAKDSDVLEKSSWGFP